MRVSIKPLSVNNAWKGRRYKTGEYTKYEKDVSKLLRPMAIPKGDLFLSLKWGFSSSGSDWDNPIKPFQDILSKKYEFNDNRVTKAFIEKTKTKKGEEFIDFDITSAKSNVVHLVSNSSIDSNPRMTIEENVDEFSGGVIMMGYDENGKFVTCFSIADPKERLWLLKLFKEYTM